MSIDARVDVDIESTQEENTPKELTVSQIIKHLKEDGMTRDQIRKKYGMTIAEAKEIFSYPKLKGLRVKAYKQIRITLIDDTQDDPKTEDNQSEIQD
jgi:hypothetical protein